LWKDRPTKDEAKTATVGEIYCNVTQLVCPAGLKANDFKLIAQAWPQLLNVTLCADQFTDKGLLAIANGCPSSPTSP
jgi:hypothetical protein